jgi:hypothetical protein
MPRRGRGPLRIRPRAKVELSEEQKAARAKLRALYKRIKTAAIVRDNADEERKDTQKEAVALAKQTGWDKKTLRFSMDGKMYSATIVAPEVSSHWNEEAVIDFLHRTGRWEACSTRAFDQTKFEAEIAAGNISRKSVEKYLEAGNPITPYARIVEV